MFVAIEKERRPIEVPSLNITFNDKSLEFDEWEEDETKFENVQNHPRDENSWKLASSHISLPNLLESTLDSLLDQVEQDKNRFESIHSVLETQYHKRQRREQPENVKEEQKHRLKMIELWAFQ